jgi:hypothetical protein
LINPSKAFPSPLQNKLGLMKTFVKKAAWQFFEKVSNGFLGNFKAANFRELVQDLMDSYQQMGGGGQYVAENALFVFTTGFLSIKLW